VGLLLLALAPQECAACRGPQGAAEASMVALVLTAGTAVLLACRALGFEPQSSVEHAQRMLLGSPRTI